MRANNESSVDLPSKTSQEERMSWKHGPSTLNPAVVMTAMRGEVRAPVADFKTFNKFASRAAWNSSSTPHETERPSSVLASLESGTHLEEVALTWMLFRRMVTRLESAGELFAIRVASSWAILAWSFLVAAKTTSAAGSPSKSNMARPIPARSWVLPFFLPTCVYKVEKRREPSAFFQPKREATANCCQGRRRNGCPAQRPFECWRKRSKNAMKLCASSESKYKPRALPCSRSSTCLCAASLTQREAAIVPLSTSSTYVSQTVTPFVSF